MGNLEGGYLVPNMRKWIILFLMLVVAFNTQIPLSNAQANEAPACFDFEYLSSTVPNRIEAAFAFLQHRGLDQEALQYAGDTNFHDADTVCEEEARVMAYLRENPQLGWHGTGYLNFQPHDPMTPEAYYKILLYHMGYQQGLDFAWENVVSFAKAKGIPAVEENREFTFEALNQLTHIGFKLADPSYVYEVIIDPEVVLPEPLPQSAGGFIAKELAKGALNYAGGELMGWGLKKAGIDLGDEDHTPEQLKAIQEGMQRMEEQLSDIKNSLTLVEAKLDQIIGQLDAIRQEQLRTQYDIRVTALDGLISSVVALQNEISDFTNYPPANPEVQRQAIIQSIRSEILQKYSSINDNLVGTLGRVPLLKLWNQIIYSNRFLTYKDYDLMKTQFDYFTQIQEAMLLLQVEYYHAIETKEGEYYNTIMRLITEHEANIEQQKQFLKAEIFDNMVLDTKYDAMFAVEKKTINGVDYLLPLSIAQYQDGNIATIIKTWNQNSTRGYNDWNYFRYLAAATQFFFSDWNVQYNDFKITGSETLMRYLTKNGWSLPTYFEMFVGINQEIDGLGGAKMAKIVSSESEKPYKLWQSIAGLNMYDSAYWFVYRQMELNEITAYYDVR
jgi:hypothetical protein